MRNIFNLDGPLFTGLNKFSDLVILNLLFVLCCLPIVTIGASVTALSYVTLKMKDGEEGYVSRSFFKSFKQNFKQATIIWLIMFALALIMFLDFRLMRAYEGALGSAVRVTVYVGALIWLMVFAYVFPLLARFENTIMAMFKNAILLAIAHAPKTLILLVVMGGSVFLTLWNERTLIWGILVWLVIGFSLISYISSTVLMPIFLKLSPPKEEEEEDVWTVEETPARTKDEAETD